MSSLWGQTSNLKVEFSEAPNPVFFQLLVDNFFDLGQRYSVGVFASGGPRFNLLLCFSQERCLFINKLGLLVLEVSNILEVFNNGVDIFCNACYLCGKSFREVLDA